MERADSDQQESANMRLESSIRDIKGIGEKAEKNFHKLNIYTVGDLLEHYPRDYDEFKDIVPISSVKINQICAVEVLLKTRPVMNMKSRFKVVLADFYDRTGTISVAWFNMPFVAKQLKMGTSYILRGMVSEKKGKLYISQPKIYSKNEFYKNVGKFLPIYPLTMGITNNQVKKAMEFALGECDDLKEFLPSEIRKRYNLPIYSKAIKGIHFPMSVTEYREARKRLAFDELFLYQAALYAIRNQRANKSEYVANQDIDALEFSKTLPYELTGAQKQVSSEIISDLESGYVMNRLVQGDVGSGKTVIAEMAIYKTVKSGYKVAFMVPTEVLAHQHYQELSRVFESHGISVCLLVGSQTAKVKREIKEQLAFGIYDVVVGTHALIQDDVDIPDLALVITDEQHRFGVRQREKLSEKGSMPHILAMSATPIPRTLALVLYGDMDISIVGERPSNRLPIKNCVVGREYRPTAYKFIYDEVKAGHQAYIICPMVEESEDSELESVVEYCDMLSEIYGDRLRVDYLHGKMKPVEKEDVMTRFGQGDIDILVSTTVVEVGIDVPNSTVMMIENSERFGLAQLHQLRGRVGRGGSQSYCIFMMGNTSKEGRERLNIIANSNDGFVIAEKDLELRGQGDFFGVMQSGERPFLIADIFEDSDIIRYAAEEVKNYDFESICSFYEKNRRFRERLEYYMGNVSL